MSEVWKPIPGRKGYEVSDLGRLRSLDRVVIRSGDWRRGPHKVRLKGQLIALSPDGEGYPNYQPVGKIHNLVMLAFVGKPPRGKQVCHNNGINDDNRLTNLRYDTPKNNCFDKTLHGTMMRGETHTSNKLTEPEVLAIRSEGGSQQSIADKYGVSQRMISMIKLRQKWAWLCQ